MTIRCFADTRFPIERANGVQTMETCHALARRGHRVTLAVRPDSASPARDPFAFYGLPPIAALDVRRIATAGAGRFRRAQFLLAAARLATAEPAGIVYTRDLGLAAWLVQIPRRRRPCVVYESHGLADVVAREMPALLGKPELAASEGKLRRLARREARVWRESAGYVAITRALADELTTRFGPRDGVAIVPDGARRPSASLPGPSDSRFIAGYAGHLYPWKGVDEFVRALALLPDVDGLVVGGHPGEPDVARVRTLADSAGVGGRLTITGLVPPSEVTARLAPASVLVLPNVSSAISERYTSPLKLFEYLGMERPIVASDLPSIREVLTDGEDAVLVPAGDAGALARAIARLRDDRVLAASLAARARALAARYTWDARAERLDEAFRRAEARAS